MIGFYANYLTQSEQQLAKVHILSYTFYCEPFLCTSLSPWTGCRQTTKAARRDQRNNNSYNKKSFISLLFSIHLNGQEVFLFFLLENAVGRLHCLCLCVFSQCAASATATSPPDDLLVSGVATSGDRHTLCHLSRGAVEHSLETSACQTSRSWGNPVIGSHLQGVSLKLMIEKL